MNPRFTKAASTEVYTGVELLVKGCLETEGGVHLWTGYPGSPIAGFFDTAEQLQELLQAKGIRAALANNEALGVAMVNGSQMSGLRSICLQKSVGIHVAADALALGNLVGANPDGGALIVLGDDPWSDSTQVPADSRYICKHLMMPVMEPGDMQEVKDWVDLGFKLSRESELYIGYLVTTNQMDGGGSAMTRQNHFPERGANSPFELPTQEIDLDRNVLLPPRTWKKEETIHERFERLWASARNRRVTRILPARRPIADSKKIGFVTSGSSYVYLRHALAELGLSDVFPILKYGITYPLDPSWLEEFAQDKEALFVIEERRGFLEEQVVEALSRLKQDDRVAGDLKIWGKRFPWGLDGIPDTRGLNPSLLIELIGKLVLKAPQLQAELQPARIEQELKILEQAQSFEPKLPARTPTFCPGCPHRDSASVLMEIKKQFRNPKYMERNHGIDPVDLLFHGDTGCYTMLMFEPTKDLMHNYSGMGLGGGTGAGIDPFIRNKQVVFMGDSTFFHSGQAAISNSLKNNQDITYIILDNKTTAMTGHQPTPGLETNLMGELTFAQNIERIVGAMTEQSQPGITVVRVNPEEREDYRRLLEKTILQDGVKILVADKECGITFHRRNNRMERQTLKQKGFLPEKKHINITSEVCENCLECTKATGCPGLSFENTLLGRKVQIDTSWCVADGACTRFMVSPGSDALNQVKACPSFEEVIVKRSQKPVSGLERLNLDRLPLPRFTQDKESWPATWRGYLAGVGGMGIGTATAVLVMAAKKEGWRALFCDKKGLAIRNGGVYSMLTFTRPDAPYTSNVIPYGKADLVLGVDLLEALRALDPKSFQRIGVPDRTALVVNSHKTPTILQLLGKDEWEFEAIEDQLRNWAKPENYFSADVSQISEALFGSKLYSNIMLMGSAYQLGKIPLRLESIEGAITEAMGAGARDNLKAFQVGRALVADPERVMAAAQIFHEPETFEAMVRDKIAILQRTGKHGTDLADAFEKMIGEVRESWQGPKETLRDLAYRIYDLIQFDSPAYARTYLDRVMKAHSNDKEAGVFKATHAVVWYLHKVMAIKDEVYVAHLLTSEEKRRRDYARYNIDPERGDRLVYRHLNRPEFNILGIRLAWDMKTRDWMLNLMKRAKWLRKVLPQWHRTEKDFREWYAGLVDQFIEDSAKPLKDSVYATWVEILELPEAVTGYREIRYPKIEQARERAQELLRALEDEPDQVSSRLEPVTAS